VAKKRDETTAGKLSAQLWSALGYLAKKRTKRELLDASTKIDVIIEGKVGRSKICEHVVGVLEVAADSQRASTEACDATHLIALLLRVISPNADKVKKSIADYHAEHKVLPEASADELANAKQFQQLLRSHVIKPVAGAITFEVSAETR
jgi:hypothetical protein